MMIVRVVSTFDCVCTGLMTHLPGTTGSNIDWEHEMQGNPYSADWDQVASNGKGLS